MFCDLGHTYIEDTAVYYRLTEGVTVKETNGAIWKCVVLGVDHLCGLVDPWDVVGEKL